VINTHWHDDHLAGNQVYQDSFPDVRFIAQRRTREDLETKGRTNREQQARFAPAAANHLERLVNLGLNGDSVPATPRELESLTNAIRIIRQYVAENPGFREVLPDSLVDTRLVLKDGGRVVELHWFGRGNTRGDLVTFLPDDGILASGDLLVSPMPFAFNSYPREWLAVLDSIAALQPRILVPGHGEIMHDLTYLHLVQHMLAVARDSTRAAVARGLSADSTLAAVQLDALRREVAGDDAWMRWAFGSFFRYAVVSRAYEEATTGTLK
jgi:cyclase